MKRFIVTILALTFLVGSLFASEREIRVWQKESKIPQTEVRFYDADYLKSNHFDKETMTNYYVTIFTYENTYENYTFVLCKAVGKDAESFSVIEKDIQGNKLAEMFKMDFDKTWEMMRNEKNN